MIWHHETPDQIAKELQTNLETGLSEDEAASRLAEFGENQYHEKHTASVWKQFGKHFRSMPSTFITIAAIFWFCYNIILLYLKRPASLIEPIILLLLPLIGYLILAIWQKYATAKLHTITNTQTMTVTVLRGGEAVTVSAADIVRGDVIFLEAGMIIPADCRLVTAEDLFMDEYILTGDETDVAKNADATLDGIALIPERVNMIYAGCGVSRGKGKAVVVSTGQSTEYALMLNDPNNQVSPLPELSKDLATLERLITLPVLVISVILMIVAVLRNLTSLSAVLAVIPPVLTIAAISIPTGLTVAAVVAMTMGMQHVVTHTADVRELSVMDTLSRVTVICADKTGTLTGDVKKPVSVYTGDEIEELTRMPSNRAQALIRLATMCTAADTQKIGVDNHLLLNPTESAIIEYARDIGIERRALMEETPRLAEIPFDANRRCMSVVHLVEGRRLMITMGAPEKVLSFCAGGPTEKAEEICQQLGERALRVLAVAYKFVDELTASELDPSQETDMFFAGLIGLADQAREESIHAIKECAQSGIITVMMTGDNESTAYAVGRQLGILESEDQVLTGEELRKMDKAELDASVGLYRAFARILPEEKERIIKAWQARGAVVASTGNCLEDVPALQSADIGCATGAADCDMTRNESDLTLYDNSFATLVEALKHARGIYANIRKVLQYVLSCSFALIVATLLTLIKCGQFPFSPIAMVLYSVFGVLCSLAISYESGDRHSLNEKPRRGLARLLTTSSWIDVLWQGVLSGVCAYLAFDAGRAGADISGDASTVTAFGMTTAFITLVLSRLWLMLTAHRHDPDRPKVANRVMPIVLFVCLAMGSAVLFIPMVRHYLGLTTVTGSNWILALILSLIAPITVVVVRFIAQIIKTVKTNDNL